MPSNGVHRSRSREPVMPRVAPPANAARRGRGSGPAAGVSALAVAVGVSLAAAPVAPAAAQTVPLPAPGLVYAQPLPPQSIQLVQQRLQQQGAYRGRIDGIWGADSQAALEAFQRTHGLLVTGQLNQATAATLGLPVDQLLAASQPAAAPALAATVAGGTLARGAVTAIQNRLRGLNFYDGAADGIWGADTQRALERFQQSRGLRTDGQLDPATVSALELEPGTLVQAR